MGQKCTSECCIADRGDKDTISAAHWRKVLPPEEISKEEYSNSTGRITPPPVAYRIPTRCEVDEFEKAPKQHLDDALAWEQGYPVMQPSHFEREVPELLSLANVMLEEPRGRRPFFRFSTGATYDGEWMQHMRHGFGRQTWPDGSVYEGQWVMNKAQGKGKFTHSTGDVYIGHWYENKAHGLGSYYDAKGMLNYHGEWRFDLQEGIGVECGEGPKTPKYAGNFQRGLKEGLGTYAWGDGSEYLGSWRENRIDGPGVYIGSDGRWFKGQWQNSVMHGIGMHVWKNGREYSGRYENDRKQGFGTYTWPDGRTYTGYWSNGKQHGQGILLQLNGTRKTGNWVEGQLQNTSNSKELSSNSGSLKGSNHIYRFQA